MQTTSKGVVIFSGSVHWKIAAFVWITLFCQNIWLNPLPMLFASLLPDADHRNAPMGKFIPLWRIFKHRTYTHTFFAMFLFSLPFFCYDWKWGISFISGYYSHLVMDKMTPSGLLFFGKNPKRYAKCTFLACVILGLMIFITK